MSAVAAWLLLGGVAAAQDPAPQSRPQTRPETRPTPGQEFEGLIVQRIIVVPPEANNAPVIVTKLKTQVGHRFRRAVIDEDLLALWSTLKVRAGYEVEALPEGGVGVTIEVLREFNSYDRVLFKGLEHLTEEDVRERLGITGAQRMNDLVADSHGRALEARYRREGYYFVRVTIERDDASSTLTFRVDEGPKVTVRDINFRGNREFPGWAPLNLYRNLTSTPGLESKPEGKILRGAAYSEQAVDEDLDRLRLFYRGLGFRDAQVELVDRQFVEDGTKVDLTLRVVEGRRYRISSVDIQQVGSVPKPDYKPLYPREEVLKVIKVKPGDHYDRDRILMDRRAIERFYGERGHPARYRYGGKLREPLEVPEPSEVFDVENATIKLVYVITEGTPKRLRQVLISGNRHTQDRVIRRHVPLYPGEILDINKLDLAFARLDDLNYFGSPEDLRGVRFELLPVDAKPDATEGEADLQITVIEGETGAFQWGGGISNDGGLRLLLQFTKRNFDIANLPSSFNPATILSEIIHEEAFHGAGQALDLTLSPGTEFSIARLTLYDPDIFRTHVDTIGMRLQGYRQVRRWDGYFEDTTGAAVGLERNFTSNFSVGLSVRQDSIEIDDIDPNAPLVVFDARGQTEIRSLNMDVRWHHLNQRRRPSEGYDLLFRTEVAGGPFGAEEDFYKFGLQFDYYWPFYRDSLDRPHVLRTFSRFDFGHEYGRSDDLFLTERFYMGGGNLRAFDQRGAGPSQFDRPVGGEARFLSTLEYQFPLVSTRLDNDLRETEFLRGLLFADLGFLGTRIEDDTFREPRLGIGVGIRIYVPQLGIPIAVDFGWPMLFEETDSRRVLFFSLTR